MDETTARMDLIETCKRLYDRQLTVSAGGNMSVRMDDCILITPSGRNKGLLRPEDLVKVAMDGTVLSGPKPSIETGFHLAIYRTNPSTKAIVHCHPLHCIAITVRGESLRCNLTPEGALLLGKVATVPYVTPGTQELIDEIREVALSNVILMERHGALTQGSNLEEAYNRMEELEFQARLQMMCGGAEDLPESELRKLGVM